MSDNEGLREDVRTWLQQIADERFDGNFGRAAAAVLTAAFEAEQEPANPWAGVESKVRNLPPKKRH